MMARQTRRNPLGALSKDAYAKLRKDAQTDDDSLEVLIDHVLEGGKADDRDEALGVIFPLLAPDLLDEITGRYAETALLAENCCDPGDDSEDPVCDASCSEFYDGDDFAQEAKEKMREDCEAFVRRNYGLIEETSMGSTRSISLATAGYIGQSFWLSRSRRGSGFLDNGFDKIHEAAKRFPELYLYEGEDGKLHMQ